MNGLNLKFVTQLNKHGMHCVIWIPHTPELCVMAIRQSGYVGSNTRIMYDVCQRIGCVLQFAREQFTEGCRVDVRQNCMALEYVHDFIVFKNIRGLYI